MEKKDAYDYFFKEINLSAIEFFNKSSKYILEIKASDIQNQWEEVKKNILVTKKEKITIRRYGRNGRNSDFYSLLYKNLLNIDIEFDSSNNDFPERTLNKWTKYRKIDISEKSDFTRIFNYQISHNFGKTKNPFLFTALWNLSYVPKYLDPFTGHETTGLHAEILQPLFHNYMYEKYHSQIQDYNSIVKNIIDPKLDECLKITKDELNISESDFLQFSNDVHNELSLIEKINE